MALGTSAATDDSQIRTVAASMKRKLVESLNI